MQYARSYGKSARAEVLSCSSDVNSLIQTTRDETETLLYPAGALSIFDEMPPEGASMFKPGQWNRVSIRYGYEPEDRKKAGGGKPPPKAPVGSPRIVCAPVCA